MWIFSTDAFVSIVEHRDDDRLLVVRARLAGDIEALFPGIETHELDESDYRYRAYVERGLVAETIMRRVAAIDYGDFKAAVDPGDRAAAYYDVWSTMLRAQLAEHYALGYGDMPSGCAEIDERCEYCGELDEDCECVFEAVFTGSGARH